MYYALDISKWQDTYDAAQAKAQGINDVVLRAAYGTSKDVKFDEFYAIAKAAGQTIGAYGFATWHYSSKNHGSIEAARVAMLEQTSAWIDICKGKVDGYFAIDQELESGYSMGLNIADNEALLNECIALLVAAGFTVCVYCSASWAMRYFNKENINADLWIAYYYAAPADPDFGQQVDYETASGTYFAYMRSCGDQLMGWQFGRMGYGATYGVGSDDVDRNVFYKSVVPAVVIPPFSAEPVRLICGYASSGDMLTLIELLSELLIPFTVSNGYITSMYGVSSGDQSVIAGVCANMGVPCVIYHEAEVAPEPDVAPDVAPDVENPDETKVVPLLEEIIILLQKILVQVQG